MKPAPIYSPEKPSVSLMTADRMRAKEVYWGAVHFRREIWTWAVRRFKWRAVVFILMEHKIVPCEKSPICLLRRPARSYPKNQRRHDVVS